MNATIARIVDIMFQDTLMTEEAVALHDEMMQNCQDHLTDLLGQGVSEDDAVARVVESLKGMEEVIATYPRRENAPAEKRSGEDAADDVRFRVAAEKVNDVRCELRGDDLRINACDGNEVRVLMDEDDIEGIDVSMEGGTLVISREKNSGKSWGIGFFNLTFGGSADITVLVPRNKALGLQAHSASGDITVTDVRLTEVNAETMSGDLSMRIPDGYTAGQIRLRTASGDLQITGDAAGLVVNSMSGDLSMNGNAQTVEAKSVSGDVRLDGAAERVNARSTSGDVSIHERRASLRQVELSSTSGDAKLFLFPDNRTVRKEVHTVSGDVRCNRATTDGDADVVVRANSVSGDVLIR